MKNLRSGDFSRFLPERLKSLLRFRDLLILLRPQLSIRRILRIQIHWVDLPDNPVPMRSPHLLRKFPGIGMNSLQRKVTADAGDIAQENTPRLRIGLRRHHLWEVNQGDVALPIENVVGGQIAVNAVVGKHQIHVANDSVKKRFCFVPAKGHGIQHRRRI